MFILLSTCFAAKAQTLPVSVAGNLSVSNSIVDNDQKYNQLGASVTINYSAVRGDVVPAGTGNYAILGTTEYIDPVALPVDEYSYFLSPLTDFVNAGNQSVPVYVPDKDINGNPRVYDGRIDIGAVEYAMIFNRGNGDWSSNVKWNIGRVPTEHDLVTIIDQATVTATDAVCKSIISIGNVGRIYVEPATQLDVKTSINNSDANKILIKASANTPNGTLIFHNPASSPVSASVEMYSMAYEDENLDENDPGKYNWQYFGVPMRSQSAIPPDGSWRVRSFNETLSVFDKWENLTANDVLTSFKGYEVVQLEEKIYTFKGILENRDTTITLNKTTGVPYAGQHLLSNPYTASIKISDMVFGNNTEATVYIYNSGSYADWNADPDHGRLGTGRGQYLAVPQNAANLILPEIPSMQGFIVRATANNGSVSIPYASATRNVSPQRAKKLYQNPHLTVELQSKHVYDRVWLLYEPTASKFFDNGWDGHKFISNDASAAIYANEPAGNLQVNTVNEFNDMYLHFKAGKDDLYTLKIVNNHLDEVYPSLFLIDLQDNKVVEIRPDTTVYTFVPGDPGKSNNRFKFSTNPDLGNEKENLIKIYSTGDYHVVIQNLTDENGSYALYDVSGRLLKQDGLKAGSYTSFTIENAWGVMILRAWAGESQKMEKILIRK